MRFDAYCATVPGADLSLVGSLLSDSVNGIVSMGKPMRRYAEVYNVDAGARTAAWFARDSASGAIYIEAKGETTPSVAHAIRTHLPEHSVPRADVCEDYDAPGAFDSLLAIVRQHKGPRVKSGFKELPDDSKDGKTWQAGVRGGVSMIRVYEAGKHPDRLQEGRPGWVRFEGEFRPQYARDKAAAARMAPASFWGFSAWSHKVAEAVFRTDLQRFEPLVRQYSADRTTLYLARTFRRYFEEQFASGVLIEDTFREIWKADDEAKNTMGRGMGQRPM